MRRCIAYHAVRQEKYLKWAHVSARSAKKQMPDVDTVLFTDLPFQSNQLDQIVRIEPVELIDAHGPQLRHLPPYDSGIFLGCDSHVCVPVYDAFELVEAARVDIALVHTSGKKRDSAYPACGVPKAYPHWRSAFIAFQDHDRTRAFFDLWARLFREHREKYPEQMGGAFFPDQMSMRIALYRSDLTVTTLPPKYCTTLGDVVIRGTVRTLATSGHGREDLVEEANREAPHARFFRRGKGRRI